MSDKRPNGPDLVLVTPEGLGKAKKKDVSRIMSPMAIEQYAQHKATQLALIAERSNRPMTAIVQQAAANAISEAFRQGVLSVRNNS